MSFVYSNNQTSKKEDYRRKYISTGIEIPKMDQIKTVNVLRNWKRSGSNDSPTRSDLLVLYLLEVLKNSNVDPTLYQNISQGTFLTDNELEILSKEFNIPLFRYIFDSNRCNRDFICLEKLGEGGFGSVFRMQHRIDKNEYAIKRIRFSFRTREQLEKLYYIIVREVQSLSKTDHPNVVRYNSCWFQPNSSLCCSEEKTKKNDKKEFINDCECFYDDFVKSPTSPCNNSENDKFLKNEKKVKEKDSLQFVIDMDEFVDDLEEDFEKKTDPLMLNNSPLRIETNTSDPNEKFFSNLSFNEEPSSGSPLKSDLNKRIKIEFNPTITIEENEQFPVIGIPSSPGQIDTNYFIEKYRTNEKTKKVFNWMDLLYNDCKKKYQMDLFIQMQLCSKYTLEDYLWSKKRVETRKIVYEEVMRFFCQIVQGLVHIHSQEIVHRDIKPANVFIYDDNNVKIGDFGLAKRIKELEEENKTPPTENHKLEKKLSFQLLPRNSTPNTSNIGTVTYASPEQLRGEIYTEKCDVFSLGLILFELLCPFSTKSERAKVLTLLKSTGEIPSNLLDEYPDEMKLVRSCLKANYIERPSSKEIFVIVDSKYRAVYTPVGNEKDIIIEKQRNEIEKLKKQINKLKKK